MFVHYLEIQYSLRISLLHTKELEVNDQQRKKEESDWSYYESVYLLMLVLLRSILLSPYGTELTTVFK